jgi:hypothetical protein
VPFENDVVVADDGVDGEGLEHAVDVEPRVGRNVVGDG